MQPPLPFSPVLPAYRPLIHYHIPIPIIITHDETKSEEGEVQRGEEKSREEKRGVVPLPVLYRRGATRGHWEEGEGKGKGEVHSLVDSMSLSIVGEYHSEENGGI